MKLNQLKTEQLDKYFDTLTPKAAEFLTRQVERDRLKGGKEFPHALVLERARDVLRQNNVVCERMGSPQREFCRPFEDLLVDRSTEIKQKGRIKRRSIDAIWNWLTNDIAKDEVPEVESKLRSAILVDDVDSIKDLSQRLHEVCVDALDASLEGLSPHTKPYSRIAAMLGGENVLADAYEIRDCLKCAPLLMSYLARIPAEVRELQGHDLELYVRLCREFETHFPDQVYLLLITLLRRCEQTSDVVKIAIALAGTNESEAMRIYPAGIVCETMLHDMEVACEKSKEKILSHSDLILIQSDLSEFHEFATALCDTLELDLKGAWGNRLVALRSFLSTTIRERISSAPRLVKAALYQKPARKLSSQPTTTTEMTVPDPQKIQEAEFAVGLLIAIKPFLGQMSIHADFARARSELEQFVEIIAERLLRNIRDGSSEEREFSTAGLPHMGQLMATLFGDETSELYMRRGRAAMRQTPGKTAS